LPNPKLIPAFEGLTEDSGFYTSKSFLPKVYVGWCHELSLMFGKDRKQANLDRAPASRIFPRCTALLLCLGLACCFLHW
jgi:hypothetical protein